MALKKGDKVRNVSDDGGTDLTIGSIYTLKQDESYGEIYFDDDDNDYRIRPANRYEKVSSSVESLKVGDIIKSTKRFPVSYATVLAVNDSFVFNTEFLRKEDLPTEGEEGKETKIGINNVAAVKVFLDNGTWTVVSAEEFKIKEITLEQIAEKFEVEVDTIRIKE